MASYADELLADFGSDDEHEIEAQAHDEAQPSTTSHQDDINGRKRAHPENGDSTSNLEEDRESKRFHLDDADLDDLEEGSDNDDLHTHMTDDNTPTTSSISSAHPDISAMQLGRNSVLPTAERDQSEVNDLDLTSTSSVRSLTCLLRNGSKVQSLLSQIDHYMSLPEPDLAGVLEDSPEYHLIVKANNIAVDVDNEVMVVHKFIRDHYSPRFPELETLIPNPWEYVQAVKAIGNDPEISSAKLEGILPHGTVVVISMTASTTIGVPLPKSEWNSVREALDTVFELESVRSRILEYVESRMAFIAPNLSAVVGTRTATKLLGVAGGLEGLTKIPACNVPLLGAAKKHLIGFSTVGSNSTRANGFIMQSSLIANTADDYKRQAVRMVSAKALLAARMDAGKTTFRDGSYGQKLYEELSKKLEKLLEPPPQKLEKVLPVPKEGSGGKKRRGGRKARKAKERNGMTELRKMQNRMEFGKQEEEAFGYDESVGLGMINSNSSGKVRAQGAEERSKGKISKANKNRLAALRGSSGGGVDGTQSSLSFTPVQGIELVDPSKRKTGGEGGGEGEKWFKQGQFSLLPGQTKSGSIGPPPPPPSSSSR